MPRALLATALMASAAAAGFGQAEIEKGERLVEVGRRSEAYFEYKAVLERDPDNSLAHYRLGELYLIEKDYRSAANAFLECSAATGSRSGPSSGRISTGDGSSTWLGYGRGRSGTTSSPSAPETMRKALKQSRGDT